MYGQKSSAAPTTRSDPASGGPPAGSGPRRSAELSRRRIGLLWLAAALAVIPGLPLVESEAGLWVRFHNWSIFVAGILFGWVLANARASLR